ncbi:hypothetical protein BDA99DRAFT_209716 [Phascolomyces articulosus]|uniref:Uncharacterized protein n=1 Tax=Phascolomyces articulosus TaxID=60185 RepID=A0AAD5JRT3_9FUNG|nr:hypothetical protein BDA99DRAFT_209716 [Phascolomyces articulosus]
MYQQQQFVERIRHTDKSIIMAIATSLKHQQEIHHDKEEKEDEAQKVDNNNNSNKEKEDDSHHDDNFPSSIDTTTVLPEVLPDIDVLYRQVLHDAEEHLRRYEMLGLTRKSRKEEYKSPPIVPDISSIPASPPASPPPSSSSHTMTTVPSSTSLSSIASSSPPPSLPPASSSSNTLSTFTSSSSSSQQQQQASSKKSTTPIKTPFTSFYKHKSASQNETVPSGARRSARNILAFGHRIPPMRECDFHLPMDEYGDAMEQRLRNKWKKPKKAVK